MKFGKRLKKSIKNEFDSEPACIEKNLEAKIKSYSGKINTNFQNNKTAREGSHFICLRIILIDSISTTSKNYHPEMFLIERKYVAKEKKDS